MAKRIMNTSANRLKSMALLHEQLYRARDLSSIGRPYYLKQLTDDLENVNRSRSTRVRRRLELDELTVGVKSVIPLGPAVNELVPNIYRRGFNADGVGGEIVVRRTGLPGTGSLLPGGATQQVRAAQRPGATQGMSLGMQLVVTLSQLGGELTSVAGHPGASFALGLNYEELATRRALA